MAETQYVLSQTAQGKKEWIPLPTGGVAAHNQAWSTITDTPTTLAGYGITDGGESMTYPASGIPLSTGAAWGSSYTTTGSGTIIALAASPTFTGTPVFSGSAIAPFISATGATDANLVFLTNSAPRWDTYAEHSSGEFKFYSYQKSGGAGDTLILSKDGFIGVNKSPSYLFDFVSPTACGSLMSSGANDSQYMLGTNNTYRWALSTVHSSGNFTLYSYQKTGGGSDVFLLDKEGMLSINGLHVGGTSDPGDNNLWIDGIAQEPNFISGWQGNNWRIEADGDAEFNNVLIRGGLSVYELIINQLHYQNGGLIIGAGAGKIATIETATAGSEVLTFHDPEGNDMVPFTAGAIVMCQRVDISKTVANGYTGDVVKKIVRQVASVSGMEVTLTTTAGWTTGDDTGVFEVGDELCAIGHTSNTSLDSALYLSATDSDNPFLRVMDGVSSYAKWSLGDKTTVKLQIGNLASLASYDIIPASPGYGLYCDNVYLNGRIVLPEAGMTNEGGDDSDIRIYAGEVYANRDTAPFRVTQDGSLTATGVAELGTKAVSIEGTSQNIAIKGSEIWENSVNANGGTLYINAKSYNAGTSYYRSLYICDGKGSGIGHHLMTLTGGATPLITMGDLGHTEDILTFDVYGSQRVYKNLTCYEDFYVGGASEFVGAVDFDDAVNMLGNVAISGPHFKVPVKTQTQINAMTPTAGMIVYNTTNGHFYGYTNAWYQLDN